VPGSERPAPALGRWPALDGIRGIAIVLVVLVHSGNSLWPAASSWLAKNGPLGVHLFFVLSGFLITTLLLTEHRRTGGIRLGDFAARRARRLLPAVLALLGVMGVVAALGDRLRVATVASSAIYVLTFTSNWAMRGHSLPFVNDLTGGGGMVTEVIHTWSLAIEAQFYAVWAVALWAATRAGWSLRRIAVATTAVVVVIAVARAVAYARGTPWLTLYITTWSRLDAPLVGSVVAIAFVAGWLGRLDRRWLVAVGSLGLAAFVAVAFVTNFAIGAMPFGLYTGLAACAAAAVAAVVIVPEARLARLLAVRPLVWLGTVSYSLYIWHYGIFWAIERHDPSWPGPVRLAVGVGLALAVSAASYRWIERPFLRRRPAPRTVAPPVPAVPA
jgi:peptidoglycan/LPS O-acetylase OafA/YrhL